MNRNDLIKWMNDNLFCDWCTYGLPAEQWQPVTQLFRIEAMFKHNFDWFKICETCKDQRIESITTIEPTPITTITICSVCEKRHTLIQTYI